MGMARNIGAISILSLYNTGRHREAETNAIIGRIAGVILFQEPETISRYVILCRVAPHPFNVNSRLCLMSNYHHGGALPPSVATRAGGTGHGLAKIAAARAAYAWSRAVGAREFALLIIGIPRRLD